MAWEIPKYTRAEVDRAGKLLIDDSLNEKIFAGPMATDSEAWRSWETWEHALQVINNWRSAHSHPLNVFQMTLRHKVARVDTKGLVSQRIKRMPAIALKLTLHPHMTLSQMQDIGGCRGVVRSIRGVYRLVDSYKMSSMNHVLRRATDYIEKPRASGYRSVHLIYRYRSRSPSPYDNQQIEVQIRSQLQHAWATAVETVGTFLRQALKSSQGEAPWLRFFALMGTAMALRERTAPVPGTPTDEKELVTELRRAVGKLQVASRLRAYGNALSTVGEHRVKGAKYFLLQLDSGAKNLHIQTFTARDLEAATRAYLQTERAIAGQPGKEAVLVSVTSLAALRRAYPSYFLDTKRFIGAVREAIRR